MPRFRVLVPFEPVVHESLESRSFAQLPTYELAGDIDLRPDGDADGHVAELEVDANRPSSAKAAAVETIERFLAVLASWNYAFQVRIGGVRSEVVEGLGSVSTQRSESGVLEVTASDTIFVEGHVEAVVQKASLDAENEFFRRYAELPEYLRSCLELNYLVVVSTRPPNRWLLAATGLEALAVGTAGSQPTVAQRLRSTKRRQLQMGLRTLLTTVELDDLRERVSERVLTTTVGPVAEHIYTYLSGLGVPSVSVEDINRWWRTRGRIAHGAPVDIEQGDLNRLITVFQSALRRTGGAEPSFASAT